MEFKKTWVYDLEVLRKIFTATFIDKDSDEKKVFVISSTKDDRQKLFTFLNEEVKGLIGYNCLHYDSQILEYLFRNPKATTEDIRRYSDIITSENDRRPDVPEWKLKVKHLDLFRALSLSVKAKRTGLKWCEFMMDLENIEDMPSQGEGISFEEMLLSYNENDVIATKELYHRYYHEIELRKTMSAAEGINLMNSTEPDMAKKIFLKYLSQETGIPEKDLRSMQTERYSMEVKDIIFSEVSFKTLIFQSIHETFKDLVLKPGEEFEQSIVFQGVSIDYGLGGLHAARKGIFESKNGFVIKTVDATSYYPHLDFQNDLAPAHLPKEAFVKLYRRLYEQRKSIPKKDPKNYILKIIINALYGLMNDQFSFVKDPLIGLTICINGELFLSMLVEEMIYRIPKAKLIMINTDGAEFLIPEESLHIYDEVCKWWEDLTRIPLEHNTYSKMIIRDVNNYISIFTDGSTKCKGAFEFQNIPLHKNKSHSIIAKAVFEYFVNNIPIEKTIKEHKNIFDFCAGVKSSKGLTSVKGASKYVLYQIVNGELVRKSLSKTVRYFVSKRGGYLIKEYNDGSVEQVESPVYKGNKMVKEWKITYFNKSYKEENFENYNVDYSYYISKAREWVGQFEEQGQTKLL